MGSTDENPGTAFGRIQSFDVDSAGRLYVLDGASNTVRIFAPTGELTREVGRSGDGPGEFRQPAGVVALGSTGFLVADPMVDRYTRFDTIGNVISVVSGGVRASNWHLVFPWQGAADSDGTILDYSSTPTGTRLLRFADSSSSGFAVDTFEVPLSPDPELMLLDAAGTLRASMPVPYMPRLLRHLDTRGTLWVGDTESYQIVHRTLAGDTVLIIERAYDRIPVTDEERDSVLAPTAGLVRSGGTVEGPAVPVEKPAFRWFTLDDQGYVWVLPYRRRDDRNDRIDVFSPDGTYLGAAVVEFEFDTGRTPIIRGQTVYTVARDSLDVQYIVIARIAGRR